MDRNKYGKDYRKPYFEESINEDNENLIIDLESKVCTLKDISNNMRNEIMQSKVYVNDLHSSYEDARSLIGRNLLNMKRILKLKSTTDGLIKMVMMFFGIILIMYILYKIKK